MKNEFESCYKALGLCDHYDEIGSISRRVMRRDPGKELMSLQCKDEAVEG